MQDQASRIALGLVLLVALWIGVYWWWPAGTDSAISVAPPEAKTPQRPVNADPPVAEPAVPDGKPTPPIVAPESQPRPAVVPPEFREHTVKAGDTYATISLRYFGTSAYANAIAKANPLLSPSNLRTGRVIRVPKDPKNIQGVPVLRPEPVVTNAKEPASEYVVEQGDTLSKIAGTVYGDSRLAGVIFEANRDQLRDEDSLRVGQKLRIPPKPKP